MIYVSIPILFFLFSSSIQAQSPPLDQLKSEITEHVIDRCFIASARRTGLTEQIGDEQALALLKAMQVDTIENVMIEVVPLVRDLPLSSRLIIYEMGANNCLDAAARSSANRVSSIDADSSAERYEVPLINNRGERCLGADYFPTDPVMCDVPWEQYEWIYQRDPYDKYAWACQDETPVLWCRTEGGGSACTCSGNRPAGTWNRVGP